MQRPYYKLLHLDVGIAFVQRPYYKSLHFAVGIAFVQRPYYMLLHLAVDIAFIQKPYYKLLHLAVGIAFVQRPYYKLLHLAVGIAFTVRIIPTKNPPNKPVGGINIFSTVINVFLTQKNFYKLNKLINSLFQFIDCLGIAVFDGVGEAVNNVFVDDVFAQAVEGRDYGRKLNKNF